MSMRVPEDQWYPVLESREVRRKPLGVERLGQLWLLKILSRRSIGFQSGKLLTEWSVF